MTYSYGTDQEWEVPVNGVAYFTFTGPKRLPSIALPIERAYDSAGKVLGEAHAEAHSMQY